jgi:hypothetical protein
MARTMMVSPKDMRAMMVSQVGRACVHGGGYDPLVEAF